MTEIEESVEELVDRLWQAARKQCALLHGEEITQNGDDSVVDVKERILTVAQYLEDA